MALTRNLPSAVKTRLASGAPLFPVMFAYVDWPGDETRVVMANTAFTWGGHTWQPVAGLPGALLDFPDEAAGLSGGLGEMRVTGTADTLGDLVGATVLNRAVEVFLGLLDRRMGTAGAALLADPWSIYRGVMLSTSLPVTIERAVAAAQLNVRLASGVPPRGRASVTHSPEDETARTAGASTLGRHLANRFKKLVNPDVWPAND